MDKKKVKIDHFFIRRKKVVNRMFTIRFFSPVVVVVGDWLGSSKRKKERKKRRG